MADDASARECDRELYEAARRGDVSLVHSLCDSGARAEAYTDYAGKGAVMMAAQRGHTEVLGVLLGRLVSGVTEGDVLRRVCEGGETCLALAAAQGHPTTVAFLLARQAPAHAQHDVLDLPISLAAYYGHAPCVRLLLDAGASPSRPDADGVTPLAAALEYGTHPKQKRLERHDTTHRMLVEAAKQERQAKL